MFKKYTQSFLDGVRLARKAVQAISLSSIVAKKICNEIDFSRPIVVVEFNPGIGDVAGEVAGRMSPTSRLLLIEENLECATALQEKFAHDERVEIVEGLAQDAEEITKKCSMEGADVVLVNVPFAFSHEPTREGVARAAKSILKSGGVFIEKVVWHRILPVRVCVARKE